VVWWGEGGVWVVHTPSFAGTVQSWVGVGDLQTMECEWKEARFCLAGGQEADPGPKKQGRHFFWQSEEAEADHQILLASPDWDVPRMVCLVRVSFYYHQLFFAKNFI
jgi:hypothetical protein